MHASTVGAASDDDLAFSLTWPCLVIVYLVLELLFYLYVRFHLYPRVNALTKSLPNLFDPWETAIRLLDLVDSLPSYSIHEFISGFFLNAPLECIRVGNFNSFLASVLLNKKFEQASADERKTIGSILRHFEDRYQFRLPEGHNSDVAHVSMSIEDVHYVHRPLFIYLFFGSCELLGSAILRCAGFQLLSTDGFSFFFRPAHCESEVSSTPVVFFHGISPGWLMYLPLVFSLPTDQPLLLLVLDSYKIASMEMSRPTAQEVCNACQHMLDQLGYARCNVVGHSFGSVVASWFVSRFPSTVLHLTLIDPVSICLGLPDVARNFLYSRPRNLMGWMSRIFAARELTIAHSLHRNFFWQESMLFLEDLPPHISMLVSVSGNDSILNARVLLEYLRNSKRPNLEVLTWPDFHHGQAIFAPRSLRKLSAMPRYAV